MRDTADETLSQSGHQVVVTYLYAEDFNPVVSSENAATPVDALIRQFRWQAAAIASYGSTPAAPGQDAFRPFRRQGCQPGDAGSKDLGVDHWVVRYTIDQPHVCRLIRAPTSRTGKNLGPIRE